MAKKNFEKIKELEDLESQEKGMQNTSEVDMRQESQPEEQVKQTMEVVSRVEKHDNTIVDGYKILDKTLLSNNGKLYPASWEFAYRCPTADEIANFSTVNEKDQPSVFAAVEDLICKCVTIVDTVNDAEISPREINDGDRLMFMLLLREFYIPSVFISYNTMCPYCKEPVEVRLVPSALRYKKLSEDMLSCFDGRVFRIPADMFQTSRDIVFHIPTLAIAGKVFQYLLKTYRDTTSDNSKDKEAFMKQFLLVAPFLFESGKETMEMLKNKFKQIRMDGGLLQAYVTIANQLKLDNLETITYTHDCGSEEEAEIRFPGGWKDFFVDKNRFRKLFE